MLDRRKVLLSGAAATSFAALGGSFAQAAAKKAMKKASADSGAPALNALFDQFMSENLDLSPITATGLGLDVGARAHERSEIDDNSLAGIAKDKMLVTSQRHRLEALDRNSVSGMDQINYDVVLYGLQTTDDADQRYDYGGGGAGSPYVISQLTGFYNQFADFLDSQQPVETKDDADAYIARLSEVALALDRDSEVVRHDVALGVIPPDFALDKTLTQMTALRGVAAEKSVMVTSIAKRAADKNIAGDWAGQATKIVSEQIYPALDRQIALVKDMRSKATHDAGVWKRPRAIAITRIR